MPRIFDNITEHLAPALVATLKISQHADFCVGYFNLRGWGLIEDLIDVWTGRENQCVRLMVGMQTLPQDALRSALSPSRDQADAAALTIDNATALRLRKRMAQEFRSQLTFGAPTNATETTLRHLAAHLRAGKVIVKLYLRHTLHAKLYLLYRQDPNNPITGFLGSSNLTMAGLSSQGELNVDVLDQDACRKLERWFADRWADRWCLDISAELAEAIETSWASETLVLPYHIYLKMAYHLSQEARAGLAEYSIPRDFQQKLLDYQVAAVQIAAHHLNKRDGVLIGDVVGLGKTLIATALCRIFQDDQGMETLILCPRNLVSMWEDYVERYRLFARVLSIGRVGRELPQLRRYRLVLIDESHNLRNREGKRFRAIQTYIETNDSKCILLTATPYNKEFLDLSAQLRLFVPEEKDLGIRPEKLIGTVGTVQFNQRYQCLPRSIAAFEKSMFIDDWRDLMRLYMVRRTRSFIQQNYAHLDLSNGRRYLEFASGGRSYFPDRVPRTLTFALNDADPADPYARLYAGPVLDDINSLSLPRYGLGNYNAQRPSPRPAPAEKKILDNLGRAGERLMGFCRTNLFKRLESGGPAFLQSIERHLLRNYIFLHALDNDLPVPLGTQETELMDLRSHDSETLFTTSDSAISASGPTSATTDDDDDEELAPDAAPSDGAGLAGPTVSDVAGPASVIPAEARLPGEALYRQIAATTYERYRTSFPRRFTWLRANLFGPDLKRALLADCRILLRVQELCGVWNAAHDAKLDRLVELLTRTHPHEKVLIFSQFADTVDYVTKQLKNRGIQSVAGITGSSDNPTAIARRFSPVSNERRAEVSLEQEIRVLIATDVLSEGQNLQDAAIVVNYDLPWAIIRLIQRAGRVDRIGQQSERILCYSFLPAQGVERIIGLRSRVRARLRENAAVVGTDETFFEDDGDDTLVLDLYNEKSGILDGEPEGEVDLASYAFQIWKNATDADPALKTAIAALPDVAYATRQYIGTPGEPQGVLVYVRTAEGNDALAWIAQDGRPVTESQLAILRAAECPPNTPAMPRHPDHHDLVTSGVQHLAQEERSTGGQLGRPAGGRYRTYTRMNAYVQARSGTLLERTEEYQTLQKAVDLIYRYPLRQSAIDALNRQIKSGIGDESLAQLVCMLYSEDRLCIVEDEQQGEEPKIICSLGLFGGPHPLTPSPLRWQRGHRSERWSAPTGEGGL